MAAVVGTKVEAIGEGSTVEEEEEEAVEGTTTGTVVTGADSRRLARDSLTVKIVEDLRCQTKVLEYAETNVLRDGTVEQEVEGRLGEIIIAGWPSVPRTIRTHAEHRQLQPEEEGQDMAAVAVTIKETEPATSIHRITTKPFRR